MSIIIHFNATSFIPPPATLPAAPSCVSRPRTKLAMVPGIDQTDRTVMTDDESSMVDIATSNTLYTHTVHDLKSSSHALGSCFGLPYQDHNYGAPPPPTPPSYSPCTSPAHANGVPDEDTNLSVVSTSTTNEETQEGSSITRCICGFEHDDEYMICCDLCLVWQHVDCMGLDRNNIPETYLCEKCEPRKVDRHKAKVLQTRKKVAMTDSSDSDEDTVKNVERKQKTRKRKRKEEELNDDKTEQGSGKRSKQMHKHTKERIEAKRSKLRRTKNKESTSTADEEAQDAWEISLEWCEKNFEPAINNQYTPEVQHLAKTLPTMGHEERFMELLLSRNCQVIDGNARKLVSVYDIPRDQPLIEYKGKFLLASQFYDLHPAFSRRLFPFVMFYTMDQDELCVDASLYGNEARFVRRSCKPNAELRHLVHNGNLHLYISSTKAVFKDDEITLPLDFSLKESIKDMECACESEDCILKFHQKNGNVDISQDKRRRGRKLTFSADDDSSHSFVSSNASPTKSRPPVKTQTSESMEGKFDHETEEQANERKKKTREERKIDAIMRAFDQMEKAAKRRQQALERQKAHHPKSEEASEKSENVHSSKEDDKVATASGSETQGAEEEKPHIPTTPKPKKGKRRRGSGTSSRRRTRTNSGGSDILSPEENMMLKTVLTVNTEAVSSSDTNIDAINVPTSCSTSSALSPVSSAPAVTPVVLKTKRFLLHEWLQEKSETNTIPSTTSPVSIRTEVKWNTSAASPTCYVQCTKDNPHSGGISAAHLRRSSTSSQIKSIPLKSCSEQGFAKKRWLRQAMYDCNTCDPLTIDPGSMEGLHLDNGYLSPPGHGEMGSPGAVDDTVTPLKKRRLMRESVESTSSPLSPIVQSSECSNIGALNPIDTDIKTESELDDSNQPLLSVKADSPPSNLCSASKEKVFIRMNGISVEHSESPRKINIKEEASDPEALVNASISSECEVSAEIVSNLRGVKSSMQKSCDLEDKTPDCIKNDCVHENNLDLVQHTYKTNDVDALNGDKSSDLYSDEKIQSNLQTHKNSSTDIPVDNDLFHSTNKCSSAERKVTFPSDCDIQSSSYSESNSLSSTRCDSVFKKETCVTQSDTKELMSSEAENDHPVSKIQKLPEDVHKNVLSDNISIHPANCESTKDISSDSVLQSPELHFSVSPVKNINMSVSVAMDCKNEQIDAANLPKKVLPEVSTADSEVLCCNSFLCDININSNHVKSSEFSDLDSKPSPLSCENSSLSIKTTCASATQKRKVSLSEYRMRMKDGSNKRSGSENIKRCTSSPALLVTAIPETLPEQVTLAPLPLFDTTTGSKSPSQTSFKSPKKKKESTKSEEESFTDVTEHRENLTERLKREFGFDDDSEGPSVSNHTKSISGSNPTLPLCAQPPPPPPPPPPRPVRSSQCNISAATAASPSQFGFTMPTSYAPPSYIVPQVPSAQFIPVQPTVNSSIIPSIHPITTPGVQCNVQPALLPSPLSFAPSLPGTILRPPIQHEYSSVNAQNFAALVQQPPPPPPPKSYSHVYQSGLYK